MKIATRIALLQLQANPADPANLWRLMLAWITPGTREPGEEKNSIDWRKNPYRQWDRRGDRAVPPPQQSAADLLAALGELMEEYPTALLGTSKLPASKETIKNAIKQIWVEHPNLRGPLAAAYLHLCHFQDGIGDAILDCTIPDVPEISRLSRDPGAMKRVAITIAAGPEGESFRRWTDWSKVSIAEMEILAQEWREFEAAQQ